MEGRLIIKIHTGAGFFRCGKAEESLKEQLHYVDHIINHMIKEHGGGFVLSVEIDFET